MTSSAGRSTESETGPIASFDVAMRRPGARSTAASGQRSPSERALTEAIGNSETRVPRCRPSCRSGGARKVMSFLPTSTQRRAGNRISPCSTAR